MWSSVVACRGKGLVNGVLIEELSAGRRAARAEADQLRFG
jgi:hypothetical protein